MSPDEESNARRGSPPGLSRRADGFEGSKIRVIFDLAEAQADDDLVRLEVGEPDFDTPAHVVEAAHEAAAGGDTHYTSTRGLAELREAIADLSASAHDREVDPAEEVLVTTGATEALYLAFLAVVDPGDEVVIPEPTWPNYAMQTRLIGGEPVGVELPPDRYFELDADAVVEAITDDTAAVVLTTPSNPTGRVYDPGALRAVVEAAGTHDAYVIADVIYERITFEGERRTVAASLDDHSNLVEINAVSKGYAMTGWRLGWLTAPAPVVEATQALRQCTSLCPNVVSQRAAIAALRGPQEPFDRMVAAYRERRDHVIDRIDAMPHVSSTAPEGAFYTMLDVSALGGSSLDIASDLLADYATVTTPGSAFGPAGEGHLRISFANGLEQLERGMDRLERLVLDRMES